MCINALYTAFNTGCVAWISRGHFFLEYSQKLFLSWSLLQDWPHFSRKLSTSVLSMSLTIGAFVFLSEHVAMRGVHNGTALLCEYFCRRWVCCKRRQAAITTLEMERLCVALSLCVIGQVARCSKKDEGSRFCFLRIFWYYCTCNGWKESSTRMDRFFAACIQEGMKVCTKRVEILPLKNTYVNMRYK